MPTTLLTCRLMFADAFTIQNILWVLAIHYVAIPTAYTCGFLKPIFYDHLPADPLACHTLQAHD